MFDYKCFFVYRKVCFFKYLGIFLSVMNDFFHGIIKTNNDIRSIRPDSAAIFNVFNLDTLWQDIDNIINNNLLEFDKALNT